MEATDEPVELIQNERFSTKQQVVDSDDEELHKILDEIENKQLCCSDWKDYSRDPSYTHFEVPYNMKCLDRYKRQKEMYEKQFQYEIAQILAQQGTAYEAARFNRHMCITTLWPPLHNRREIMMTQRYFFRLTPKQRKRYNYIMSTKII